MVKILKKTIKKIILLKSMKYEIASELGLIDKVSERGWAGLTAKEAGKIGGMLTARKKKLKKQEEENKGNDSEDESI